MNRPSRRPVTVEDLIRLKRLERPASDYWARFDAEMRAKQLAAIVGTRTWWQGSERIIPLLARLRMPIIGAAVLALGFVGARYVAFDAPSRDLTPRFQPAVADGDVPTTTLDPLFVESRAVSQPKITEVKSSQSAVAVAPAAEVPASATESSELPSRTPFSEMVAVTLARFRESQPDLGRRSVFGSDQEFEATMASFRQEPPAEPLARLDPASEERRSRLLATALPAYATTSPHSAASERLKERVSNDRIYESMDPYESNTRMSLEIKF